MNVEPDASQLEELRVKNAQLEQALASRIVIEQAKGVLAERYRLDMQRAFEVLRGAARSNRVRIHELAEAVVSSPRTPTAIELELLGRPTTSSSASRR
jgi:AmiR/NasT family two-component response regulator